MFFLQENSLDELLKCECEPVRVMLDLLLCSRRNSQMGVYNDFTNWSDLLFSFAFLASKHIIFALEFSTNRCLLIYVSGRAWASLLLLCRQKYLMRLKQMIAQHLHKAGICKVKLRRPSRRTSCLVEACLHIKFVTLIIQLQTNGPNCVLEFFIIQ